MTTVSIVGAGPGAPDLLTRRAENRLQSAQVLIWTDSLVSPQIAALAPDHCETIRSSTLTLEDVLPLMIDRAKKACRLFVFMTVIPACMERFQSKFVA